MTVVEIHAVAGYQRRKLDELGFHDVCPECRS